MKKAIFITFLSVCCIISASGNKSISMIDIAGEWNKEGVIVNLSDITGSVDYRIVHCDNYGSIGNIVADEGFTLFKQTLYNANGLLCYYDFRNYSIVDNGAFSENGKVFYFHLSNHTISIFTQNGEKVKDIPVPKYVGKLLFLGNNKMAGYRTSSVEIKDDNLSELCVIDISTSDIIYEHTSISREQTDIHKQTFDLFCNKMWSYRGKALFFEIATQKIYEVKNGTNGISLDPLYRLSIIQATKSASTKCDNKEMDKRMKITSIKELDKCIIFNVTYNKTYKKFIYFKDKAQLFNIKEIKPDIDNISLGQETISVNDLTNEQISVLKDYIDKKRISTQLGADAFAIPIYK